MRTTADCVRPERKASARHGGAQGSGVAHGMRHPNSIETRTATPEVLNVAHSVLLHVCMSLHAFCRCTEEPGRTCEQLLTTCITVLDAGSKPARAMMRAPIASASYSWYLVGVGET